MTTGYIIAHKIRILKSLTHNNSAIDKYKERRTVHPL